MNSPTLDQIVKLLNSGSLIRTTTIDDVQNLVESGIVSDLVRAIHLGIFGPVSRGLRASILGVLFSRNTCDLNLSVEDSSGINTPELIRHVSWHMDIDPRITAALLRDPYPESKRRDTSEDGMRRVVLLDPVIRPYSLSTIVAEGSKLGLSMPCPFDAFCFALQHQAMQERFPIAFLHQPFLLNNEPEGNRQQVLCLSSEDGKKKLKLFPWVTSPGSPPSREDKEVRYALILPYS